jgi:hypothetical protein
MVRDILDTAWEWFKEKVVEIVKTVIDAVLLFVDVIDGALEILWQKFAKPTLQTVFPILWRIFSFPVDVLEFILGKAYDLFMYLYGLVDTLIHEVEFKIYDVVVSAVRSVYDFVTSMFVNVYNAVRSLYVGVRDVTSGFILGTVRRIRERLHTIITVDLWILGCWRAFQGSLESFSLGDFLKSAVLCLMAPVASGYIAGIITSLTPMPGTEFPGFIPPLDFPEIRVEDMPRFSVVTPPPISFPTVGVSTLPFAPVVDLGVRYEVVSVFEVAFAPVMGLDVGYVVEYGYALRDSVGVSLSDEWGWEVGFNFDLSDSAGIGLSDGWILWMDEIQLVSFAGVSVFYPAIADVVDSPAVVVSLTVSYPAIVDVVDSPAVVVSLTVSYPAIVDVVDSPAVVVSLTVSYPAIVDVIDSPAVVVSLTVSYPAIVDVIDLVVGAGVSVG